jgi:5-methylthioadenosine/S-adenosylhomocysteine deaminase
MPFMLHDGHVVTMDADRAIHDPGFVLVGADGRIAAVGPMSACPDAADAERIDCHGRIVVPGLIDLFQRPWTHLLPGMAAAQTVGAAMTPDEHALAARLCGEALAAAGVTSVLAAMPTSSASATTATRDALAEAGLRVVIATPNREAAEPGDALLVEADLLARARGQTDDAIIAAAYRHAGENGMRLVTRHWPDGTEPTDMLAARARIGRSSVQHLMEMGVLDGQWILVSPVQLDATDRAMIGESGCHLVGLPLSEAAAGSGTTDLSLLARAGANCALGTDGVSRGWTTDMVEQMKSAVMSQNTLSMDVLSMSAERAIEMATINAARALGWDDVGALAVGMRADIAVFDMTGTHFGVHAKPLSGLVTCAKAGDAELVLRNGRPIHRRAARAPSPHIAAARAARSSVLARAADTTRA